MCRRDRDDEEEALSKGASGEYTDPCELPGLAVILSVWLVNSDTFVEMDAASVQTISLGRRLNHDRSDRLLLRLIEDSSISRFMIMKKFLFCSQ